MGIDSKGIHTKTGVYFITWEFQLAFWLGVVTAIIFM